MIATVVTPSINAAQVCALIALILFIVGGVVAFMTKTVYAVLICAGLAFLSAACLWGLTG